MGKPLMLQQADDDRIEVLKRRLKAPTKIAVVRSALDLLEEKAARDARVARWRRAAKAVAAESRKVQKEFSAHSRLHQVE